MDLRNKIINKYREDTNKKLELKNKAIQNMNEWVRKEFKSTKDIKQKSRRFKKNS